MILAAEIEAQSQHDQNYTQKIQHVVIISDKLLYEYVFYILLNFLN